MEDHAKLDNECAHGLLGYTYTMKYSFMFLEGVEFFTKHQHILFGEVKVETS